MTRFLYATLAAMVVAATAPAQMIIYKSPPPTEYYVTPYSRPQPLVYPSGASYQVNPIWYPNYNSGFGGAGHEFRGYAYNGSGNGGPYLLGGGYGGGFYGGAGFYSGGYRRR